jgi:hypothetical protein
VGHYRLMPIRSGNLALVTFDYHVLSNSYCPAASLTGGTQFVTFYQSFTKPLPEQSAVIFGQALSCAVPRNCRQEGFG